MLKKISFPILITLVIISGILTLLIYLKSNKLQQIENNRFKLFSISRELRLSSEDLTKFCRTYVSTGDDIWEKKYWEVLDSRNGKIPRPDGKKIALKDSIKSLGIKPEEFEKLELAEKNSNDLVETEETAFHAMKGQFRNRRNEFTINRDPDVDFARRILFDDKYHQDKEKIMKPIREFITMINDRTFKEVQNERREMRMLIMGFSIVFILIIIFSVNEIFFLRESIYQKNKEVTILNEKLQTQNQELIASNTSKDKLFSIIAHDLKSPFNAILGCSSLLFHQSQNNKLENDTVEKYADIIMSSSVKANNLLKSLMEWSLAESGRTPFKLEPLNLNDLIDDTIELLQISIDLKRIHVTTHSSENLVIYADKNMMNTILRNLLDNAIKFTPKGGAIEISTEEKKDYVTVAVKDNGIGIRSKDQSKLFGIEHQKPKLGTANEMGTGFGLALCRQFVEKHDGKIWVESTMGIGSTFYFTIPSKK